MSNNTFKAIAPKAYMTFGLAAVALTVSIAISINATAKSMTDTEYSFLAKNIELEFTEAKIRCDSVSGIVFDKCIAEAESKRDASRMELEAKRKISVSSQSASNAASAYTELNTQSSNTNSMPVIDRLNSNFKRSRLI